MRISVILCAIIALSSCANGDYDKKAASAPPPQVASASKVPTVKLTKGYGVPMGTFGCGIGNNSTLNFKIYSVNSYSGKNGQSGNYTVLNDDLIYFQSANLKGYFGQIQNSKQIRIFKTIGKERKSYTCEFLY